MRLGLVQSEAVLVGYTTQVLDLNTKLALTRVATRAAVPNRRAAKRFLTVVILPPFSERNKLLHEKNLLRSGLVQRLRLSHEGSAA